MSIGPGHQPRETRPGGCRNRLRDEGKPYPRSGCDSCGDGGLRGCPYDRRPDLPASGSGVIPPKGADQLPKIERATVLDVRPTDLIVLEVPQFLSVEQHHHLYELMKEATGHPGRIMILHGGAKIGVVRSSGEPQI